MPPPIGPDVGLIDVSVGTTGTGTGGVYETSADGALTMFAVL